MATDGYTSDNNDSLLRESGQFSGLAQRAGTIHTDLDGVLGETGACWGDDEVGRSFAATHLTGANDALGKLGALSGQLTDVGNRYETTGKTYASLEDHGAQRFKPTQA